MATDDPNLLDCFVHLPSFNGIPFVLDYNTMRNAQGGDARLQALAAAHPEQFALQLLAPDTQLLCYLPGPNQPWKICLPTTLLDQAVHWYHYALGHLGQVRLYDTMSQHLYHPDLRNRVEYVVSHCTVCQRNKQLLRGHGELAPREARIHPWREVAVDLVGPWTLIVGNQEIPFLALTIIDTVTNLVELVRLDNKTSAHVALQFQNTWLARYPRPMFCIHDQGGEFTGYPYILKDVTKLRHSKLPYNSSEPSGQLNS